MEPLPFGSSVVGGHGVDPRYLARKAQKVGYHPEVILAGRRVNDSMGHHVGDETITFVLCMGLPMLCGRALVFGLTFRENRADIRNTRVVDIVRTLRGYKVRVDIDRPWIHPDGAEHQCGLQRLPVLPTSGDHAAITPTVGHRRFVELGEAGVPALGRRSVTLFDPKGVLPLGAADARF